MPDLSRNIGLIKAYSDSKISPKRVPESLLPPPNTLTGTIDTTRKKAVSDNTGRISKTDHAAMRKVYERVRLDQLKRRTDNATQQLTNPHRKRNTKDRAHPETMLTNVVKSNMNRSNQIGGDPVARFAESTLGTVSAVGLTVGMVAITGGVSLFNVIGAGMTASKTLEHVKKNQARNNDFKLEIAQLISRIISVDEEDAEEIKELLHHEANPQYHLVNLFELSEKNAQHYGRLKIDAASHAGIGMASMVALAGVAGSAIKQFHPFAPQLFSPAFIRFEAVATGGIPFTIGGLFLTAITANRVRIDAVRLGQINQSIARLNAISRAGLTEHEQEFLNSSESFFQGYARLLKSGISLTSVQSLSLAFLSLQRFLPIASPIPIVLAATAAVTGYTRFAHIQPRLDDRQFIAQLQKWFDSRLPMTLSSCAKHSAQFQNTMNTIKSARKALVAQLSSHDKSKLGIYKILKAIWPGLNETYVNAQRKALAANVYDSEIKSEKGLNAFLGKASIMLTMMLDCVETLEEILITQHDSIAARKAHLQAIRDQEIAYVEKHFFTRQESLEVTLEEHRAFVEHGQELNPKGVIHTPASNEIALLNELLAGLVHEQTIAALCLDCKVLSDQIEQMRQASGAREKEAGDTPVDYQQIAQDCWQKLEAIQTQFINVFAEGKNSVTKSDMKHLKNLAQAYRRQNSSVGRTTVMDGPVKMVFRDANPIQFLLCSARLTDIEYDNTGSACRNDPRRTNKSFFKALTHIEDSLSRQKTNLYHLVPGILSLEASFAPEALTGTQAGTRRGSLPLGHL